MIYLYVFGLIVFTFILSYLIFYLVMLYRVNTYSLKNKTVLITGAGNGLGRVLCHEFVKEKCNVICVDIDQKGNENTVEELKILLKGTQCKVQAYTCDVSDRSQVKILADTVKKDFEFVDILVNNAGVINMADVVDFPEHIVRKIMDVNVLAHFWTIQEFLPEMLKKNKGTIVAIASVASFGGVPQIIPYCTSKYAVLGLMDSLRAELRLKASSVKTLSIHPGIMKTDMLARHYKPQKSFSRIFVVKPEYVAQNAIKALKQGKSIAVLPSYYYIFMIILDMIIPFTNKFIQTFFKHSIVIDTKTKKTIIN